VLTWKCFPLLVPILLCGCARGIDRDAIRERPNNNREPNHNRPTILEEH
jgi:hypothetical protein